jgi:hypothetical protein
MSAIAARPARVMTRLVRSTVIRYPLRRGPGGRAGTSGFTEIAMSKGNKRPKKEVKKPKQDKKAPKTKK